SSRRQVASIAPASGKPLWVCLASPREESMSHKFLVHAPHDNVGVAIRDIHAGETVEGVVLENDSVVTVSAIQDVPLGHKIALAPLPIGGTVIKYSVGVGAATAAIRPGEHVHVHNIKSARW